MAERTARSVIRDVDDFAAPKGTGDPFRYLNYAASGQDVFGGYGEENRLFLQDVSRRYDPEGFYQEANTGGFRLWANSFE